MQIRLILMQLCCMFFAASLFSLQSPKSQQEASLLAQHSHAALSGPSAADDVTLTGTVRRIAGSIDESGTVSLKAMASGEIRMDFNLPSGGWKEVVAHTAHGPAGQWTGSDGKVHEIKQHNLAVETAWFFPGFVVRRMATAPPSLVEHAGREIRGGRALEHLSASRKFQEMPGDAGILMEGLSRCEVYLDPSTFLPESITFNTHPDSNALRDIPVEVRFSDYRSVSGAQIPFHVQQYLNGNLVLELQFETAVLNSGLNAGAFTLVE